MGFYFLQPEDGRLLILNLPPHQRHSPCPLDCWTGGLGPLRCSSLYMTQRTHQDNGRTSVGLSYFLPVTFRTGGGGGFRFPAVFICGVFFLQPSLGHSVLCGNIRKCTNFRVWQAWRQSAWDQNLVCHFLLRYLEEVTHYLICKPIVSAQ